MFKNFDRFFKVNEIQEYLNIKFTNAEKVENEILHLLLIKPGQKILCINYANNEFRFIITNWGLRFKNNSPLIFTTRSESVIEKPYWRNLFKMNKILIPMTGIELRKTFNNHRIHISLNLLEHKLFFAPGVYTYIDDKICASILTTDSNEKIKKICKRMPVILTKDTINKYFNNSVEDNLELFKPLSNSIEIEFDVIK